LQARAGGKRSERPRLRGGDEYYEVKGDTKREKVGKRRIGGFMGGGGSIEEANAESGTEKPSKLDISA